MELYKFIHKVMDCPTCDIEFLNNFNSNHCRRLEANGLIKRYIERTGKRCYDYSCRDSRKRRIILDKMSTRLGNS